MKALLLCRDKSSAYSLATIKDPIFGDAEICNNAGPAQPAARNEVSRVGVGNVKLSNLEWFKTINEPAATEEEPTPYIVSHQACKILD